MHIHTDPGCMDEYRGVGATTYKDLQDRLDDRVSGLAFGLTGETTQIATTKLQNAHTNYI